MLCPICHKNKLNFNLKELSIIILNTSQIYLYNSEINSHLITKLVSVVRNVMKSHLLSNYFEEFMYATPTVKHAEFVLINFYLALHQSFGPTPFWSLSSWYIPVNRRR